MSDTDSKLTGIQQDILENAIIPIRLALGELEQKLLSDQLTPNDANAGMQKISDMAQKYLAGKVVK